MRLTEKERKDLESGLSQLNRQQLYGQAGWTEKVISTLIKIELRRDKKQRAKLPSPYDAGSKG